MTKNVDLDAISADAESVLPTTDTPSIDDLAEKLEQVDLLIADLGQINEFQQKARDFADEAATEIRWNRIARVAVLVVALAIVISLAVLTWLIVSSSDFSTLRSNPTAFSSVIVAAIGGGILLCHGISKSVFSSFAERNTGMPLPEHFKAVTDAVRDMFGR